MKTLSTLYDFDPPGTTYTYESYVVLDETSSNKFKTTKLEFNESIKVLLDRDHERSMLKLQKQIADELNKEIRKAMSSIF